MKILNAEQIREVDAFTISHEPVSSLNLMERAAEACVKQIEKIFHRKTLFKVVCGTGNNGGDGLAIARILHNKGYKTEVYIVPFFSKRSDDFILNHKRLEDINALQVKEIADAAEITLTKNEDAVIIDAVLGSGVSKPVKGKLSEVIQKINSLKCPVISIDMPSGLMMEDNSGNEDIVSATYTLTFETPKLSFFFADNAHYVGDFFVLDIGLNKKFIAEQKAKNFWVTQDMLTPILKHRQQFSHKGNYGHALLVAGSYGKMGAAILAAKSCLRSGVGLLTVHTPKCGYNIIQTAVPEAMADVDEQEYEFSAVKNIAPYKVIGTGPGLGNTTQTAKGLKMLIQNSKLPLVLDADALNILAENKTWLSFLPSGTILTPHPGEFERLAGKQANGFQIYTAQKELAAKYGIYIVLKGAFTSVATPEGDVFFNPTGNPGMATAGSGDVLTGIITGLLAQGYAPNQAAILGVYLHGLAGDIAADKLGHEAMIAGDITANLSKAFKQLHNK